MDYEPKKMLNDFKKIMVDIKHSIPEQYSAFLHEKESVMKSGKITDKNKWLLMLVAAVSQKCPVCVARAVEHCVEAGWGKEEMLEGCMVAVLVGGSSVMTYVTLADKAIEEIIGKKRQ